MARLGTTVTRDISHFPLSLTHKYFRSAEDFNRSAGSLVSELSSRPLYAHAPRIRISQWLQLAMDIMMGRRGF